MSLHIVLGYTFFTFSKHGTRLATLTILSSADNQNLFQRLLDFWTNWKSLLFCCTRLPGGQKNSLAGWGILIRPPIKTKVENSSFIHSKLEAGLRLVTNNNSGMRFIHTGLLLLLFTRFFSGIVQKKKKVYKVQTITLKLTHLHQILKAEPYLNPSNFREGRKLNISQ